jgi:antitoxin MazE
MTTTLQKWGNSLAVRIPKTVANDVALGEGEAVDLRIANGEIVIAPIRAKKYRLEELVSRISGKNRHPEARTGKQVGREAW